MTASAVFAEESPIIAEDAWPWRIPRCPGCGGAWQPGAGSAPEACERCGLERADAERVLASGVAVAYATARSEALQGRFAEARQRLAAIAHLAPSTRIASIDALDRLCAQALGAAEGDGGEALTLARADYQAAHRASVEGDFAAAVLLARRAVSTAPQILAAQKLLVLALAAMEAGEEAERRRSELAALFPGEPDLYRWSFAPIAAPNVLVDVSEPAPADSEAPAEPVSVAVPTVSLRRQGERRWRTIRRAVSPALSGIAAVLALVAVVRVERLALRSLPETSVPVVAATATPGLYVSSVKPTPFASATPALPVTVRGTTNGDNPSDKENAIIASDLVPEMAESRRQADEAQARLWFNRAVRARRAGDWRECERLASAAYVLGRQTYLGDEALLLRAQVAEAIHGDAVAAMRYAMIAEAAPGSLYADWALGRATRLARRSGHAEAATTYEKLRAERRRKENTHGNQQNRELSR